MDSEPVETVTGDYISVERVSSCPIKTCPMFDITHIIMTTTSQVNKDWVSVENKHLSIHEARVLISMLLEATDE